ncbi:glucan synthase-like 8 [Perilla frutescens var. frutescens]|nr:glucan synthase-like 8 [Perilla frutescens var. frutescens]
MSRNYDNWERLVTAVVKREQIWQLCHQDSIRSSILSDDSSDLELSSRFSDLPFSLGSFDINTTFKSREGDFATTNIALLLQDVRVSDRKCFAKGSKAAIKSLKTVKVTEDQFKQRMIVLA